MVAGLDVGTLGLGLVMAGVVAGLVAGMLGAGGGIVIVPVLYHVLGSAGVPEDLRMHLAVGTSLAAIVPTSLSSLSAHAKQNAVDGRLVRLWAAPMLLGAVAGTAIAGLAPGQLLALVFGAAAVPIAANLALGKESWRLSDHIARGPVGALLPFGIGALAAMMGIGGGSIGVPAMTLSGMPVKRAVGTAAAFAAIVAIAGAIGAVIAGWGADRLPPFSYGYVNLLAFAVIAPVTFVVAPLGIRFAHLADRTRLARMFALFVVLTAAKMVWDALG